MRAVGFPQPPFLVDGKDQKIAYLVDAIRQICEASYDTGFEEIADSYTITNLTETRTLDCSTATAGDIADVLGTLIFDMQKRAVNRG